MGRVITVDMAIKALEDFKNPAYTLGPIIHNPQEVERLRKKGILMANSLEEIGSGTVIIRSHGAPKGVIDLAQNPRPQLTELKWTSFFNQ